MSWRAAILGAVVGLLIAGAAVVNDSIVRQTSLIGHLMPIGVVGPAAVLGLWIASRQRRGWSVGELCVACAIALAACGWTGSAFFRFFAPVQVMPAHLQLTRPTWQAADVAAYVPLQRGVLLHDGRHEPEQIQRFLHGSGHRDDPLQWIAHVDWDAWRPPLLRWGGLALALGLASICIVAIVHPQWSRHEQLPYPVARFIERLALPMDRRLLLAGLGSMIALHTVNGLNVWLGTAVRIPLALDLTPLTVLFPDVSRAGGAGFLFRPLFVPTVIAFCWFVAERIALSVGLAQWLWVGLGAALISGGLSMATLADGQASPMLALGACIGVAIGAAYTGRFFYARVVRSAVGLGTSSDVPTASVWALRCLVVLIVAAVVWLAGAGVHWSLALVFTLLSLLLLFALTRVHVETGMLFLQIGYGPAAAMLGLFGFEAIGPTATLVLLIAGVTLLADPRQALMAFAANGLRLMDRGGVPPCRGVSAITLMAIASFAVALLVALPLQMNLGGNVFDWPATQLVPSIPFDTLATQIIDARATGTLDAARDAGGGPGSPRSGIRPRRWSPSASASRWSSSPAGRRCG